MEDKTVKHTEIKIKDVFYTTGKEIMKSPYIEGKLPSEYDMK